jgi:hypothetical protein
MTTIGSAGLILAETVSDDECVAATVGLPVDDSTTSWRTLYRVALRVCPGDVVRAHGEGRVTNDVGRLAGQTRYTVGVGWHLWIYNASAPSELRNATWQQIGTSMGDNVTVDRHHMPLCITRDYQVPASWTVGDYLGVALRADAHSTSWEVNGGHDVLTVDRYGILTVERWTAPPPAGP